MRHCKDYSYLIGQKIEMLTALEILPRNSKGKVYVVCLCDCGNVVNKRVCGFISGSRKSCGCLRDATAAKLNKTHALSKSKVYKVYNNMVNRCNNENTEGYEHYGGRGITVCDRWLEPSPQGFLNFLEDMGDCPTGMSLDRVDVDKGYSKENCRWADATTQAYNQRKSRANKSGRTGVWWAPSLGKWRASIQKNRVSTELGVFETFEAACRARELAEIELYGVSKT